MSHLDKYKVTQDAASISIEPVSGSEVGIIISEDVEYGDTALITLNRNQVETLVDYLQRLLN